MQDDTWKGNALFEGLSPEELVKIQPHIFQATYQPHEVIMQDGSEGSFVFMITDGDVRVFKDELKLAALNPGDMVGLMAIIDGKPRSATVLAGEKGADGYVISKEGILNVLHDKNTVGASRFLFNYLRNQQDHMRNTNELSLMEARQKLAEEKKRVVSAHFFAQMVLGLIIFIFLLGVLTEMAHQVESTFISFGLLFAYAVWSFFYIRHSHLPMKAFGVSLSNLRPAMRLSVPVTAVFVLFLFLLKWLMITFWPHKFGDQLIDFYMLKEDGWLYASVVLIVYSLHAILQEFIARSCIQGGLMEFIGGKWSEWKSIILATLMFSSFHIMIDIKYGMLTIVPGLLWGYLFYRHRNLLAVSFSHIVIGIVALFVLNLM